MCRQQVSQVVVVPENERYHVAGISRVGRQVTLEFPVKTTLLTLDLAISHTITSHIIFFTKISPHCVFFFT